MSLPVAVGLAALPSVALQTATPTSALAAELPGVGLITDAIDGVAGWTLDQMTSGVASWVLSGVAYFANGVLNFLKTSARPQVEAAWFAGPGSPLATVRSLAVVLITGFLFLGFLQGLVRGDPAAMIRRLVADLPMAVLGMVATVTVVAKLLDLTDALSTAVLSHADGQALAFLSRFGVAGAGSHGFAVVVVGLVAIVAALVLWVELMVRSALVYLLVAISPLAFAAMVWPAARGALRRMAQLLLAVILSKFVIAVALAVGVAALGGRTADDEAVEFLAAGAGGTYAAGIGQVGDPAASLGTLLVGGVVLALAAFAPFIVLRLIPVAEAALAAQGISRGPMRATQSGVGTYYYANSLTRLGGSSPPNRSSALAATTPTAQGNGPRPGSSGVPPGGAKAGGAAGTVGSGAAAAVGAARAAGRTAASTARQATEGSPPPRPPAPAGPAARTDPRAGQSGPTRRTI